MTHKSNYGARIEGGLRSANGRGIVQMTVIFDHVIEDVWSAITEPQHLARWYGDVTGDLRQQGRYQAHVRFSGWEGEGTIEVCAPPHRLVVTGKEPQETVENVTDIKLSEDGDKTVMALEQRGLPLEYLAAFAAGMQVHIEDLAAYLSGAGNCDGIARMKELIPVYEALEVLSE